MKLKDVKAGTKFRSVKGAEDLAIQNAQWTVVAHCKDGMGNYDGTTLCVLASDNGVYLGADYLDGDSVLVPLTTAQTETPEAQQKENADAAITELLEAVVGVALLGAILDELKGE